MNIKDVCDIKFTFHYRAWDTVAKVMHEDAQNGIYENTKEAVKLISYGELITLDRYVVMPYTGVYDMRKTKYKKEICLNDTVLYKDRTDEIVGIVKYGLYGNPFDKEKTNVGFYIEWIGKNVEYLRNDLGYWQDKIIVNGNIYTNNINKEDV